METEHKGHFKFENGVSLDIDPGLLISSSVVKEAASNASSSFEVPVTNEIDQNELELMNEFTALLREKFAEDFKSKAASKDFWFEFIVSVLFTYIIYYFSLEISTNSNRWPIR
jgi:hypothetical protein